MAARGWGDEEGLLGGHGVFGNVPEPDRGGGDTTLECTQLYASQSRHSCYVNYVV